MGNQLTGTELAAIIPEIWRNEVMSARYSAQVSDKVCFTDTPEIKAKGDIYHIPIFPRLTTNAVGATDGTVTNQSVTLTDNSITINNHREATVEILDSAGWQSFFGDSMSLARKFGQQFGSVLAERIDNDQFALVTGFTTASVGNPAAPGENNTSLLRQAYQRLDENRVPKSQRYVVYSPQAMAEIMGEDKATLAQNTGLSRGVPIAGPDIIPTLYGVKVFQSPEIAAVAGPPAYFRNVLAHKEGWVLIIQKNIQIVVFAKVALTTRINGNALYEGAIIRGNHGVQIITQDT